MLLFDLDGTLLDSNGIWTDVDAAFLRRRGLPYTRAYYEGVAHTTFPLAAQFTREYCRIPDSPESIMAEWMLLAGDRYATQVSLKPCVPEFLQACQAAGEPMAVLTSAVPAHCRAALQRHRLQGFFRQLIFAQELGLEKRDPRLFLRAAELCGARPEDCVLFDDSILSCRSAKSVGMRVVGVYDDYFRQDEGEMRALCHRYIHSFSELLPAAGT